MFQLDDQFLADVGLAELPEENRVTFLQHVYDELQLRVGTRLSDGMSDRELTEFESIIDRDVELIATWLDAYAPDFLEDPVYGRMTDALKGEATPTDVVCEYAGTKWLEINSPDYREIVKEVLDDMKSDIRRRANDILEHSE